MYITYVYLYTNLYNFAQYKFVQFYTKILFHLYEAINQFKMNYYFPRYLIFERMSYFAKFLYFINQSFDLYIYHQPIRFLMRAI